jgi:hypothetical protein
VKNTYGVAHILWLFCHVHAVHRRDKSEIHEEHLSVEDETSRESSGLLSTADSLLSMKNGDYMRGSTGGNRDEESRLMKGSFICCTC